MHNIAYIKNRTKFWENFVAEDHGYEKQIAKENHSL